MDRRCFITTAVAAAGGVALNPFSPSAAYAATPDELRLAARNAWLWGMPLIEMAEQRAARSAEGAKVNAIQHQRDLITAKDQFVTTPNNDTLYSQAWLNLEQGPVTITIPSSGDRYYCAPFMDMYSNNFAIVGSRTTGGAPIQVTLVGPAQATDNVQAIRAPTNWVWMLGRTLVADEADLAMARAFQDGWRIDGPDVAAPRTFAKRTAPWNEFLAAVQNLMNENPPPVTDALILASMAPLVALGQTFDATRFAPQDVDAIRAGIAEAPKAMAAIRQQALTRNGWQFPLFGLGNFGTDYAYRAAVAIGGLGALPRAEAVYLRAAGPDGRGFDSAANWRLTFGPDELPPVNSFWSLSMYRLTKNGQLFFADNPIDRFAIGDRTPGLKRAADGSLAIVMARTDPKEGAVNWLPTPAEGRFVLILRAYLPKPQLMEGAYAPPSIMQA